MLRITSGVAPVLTGGLALCTLIQGVDQAGSWPEGKHSHNPGLKYIFLGTTLAQGLVQGAIALDL